MTASLPPTEAEMTEAKKAQHSRRVVCLVPLQSGRFAVYGVSGILFGFASSLEEAITMTAAAYAAWDNSRFRAPTQAQAGSSLASLLGLDLSDIEL